MDWWGIEVPGEAPLSHMHQVRHRAILALPYVSKLFSRARELPLRKIFVAYSYLLVPFGLLAWIAFSLPLLMVNGSYIIQVLSDPFGWGWDLFGTAHFPWTPFYPEAVPHLQALILLIGLVF